MTARAGRSTAIVAAAAVGAAIAAALVTAALVTRGPRRSPGATAVGEILALDRAGGRATGPSVRPASSPTAMRQLLAENFALQAETERLQQALAAPVLPIMQGLPAAPIQEATADELKLMDEIHARLASDARPAQARLYAEVKGQPPPDDLTLEQIATALLEGSGLNDFQSLNAEMQATKALRRQNATPPPGAPLARRVLWLLSQTGDAMEQELEGALSPERLSALHQDGERGFGFSVSLTNGRWLVELSRPGS